MRIVTLDKAILRGAWDICKEREERVALDRDMIASEIAKHSDRPDDAPIDIYVEIELLIELGFLERIDQKHFTLTQVGAFLADRLEW